MKRTLFISVALVAAAFILVAILRWRPGQIHGGGVVVDPAKQKIKDFWTVFNTANSLRTQGKFRQAADAYRKCLDLNPQHEDSLYYLGTSFYELGEYREAAQTLRKMTELNPESGRAFSHLGNTLSVLAPGSPADFEAARQAYRRNLEVNKEQAGPFLRLGTLDLNQGRLGDALAHFRVAAASGAPEASYFLAYTLFLQGKYNDAIPLLRKVLDAYGRDKKITGRGVLSEGDVLPEPGKQLTALEKAGLKSILLLFWIAQRTGGYPAGIAREFQLPAASSSSDKQSRWTDRPIPLQPGGRAAWGDADKDGRPDLVVAGGDQPLAFYRNQNHALVDATREAGLSGLRRVWDATWVDYDADRALDLYLIRSGYIGSGQNRLYRNQHGGFADVTESVGLDGERATAHAAFFDSDGDGRMDLVEAGASDEGRSSVRFFRNRGGRFTEQTREAELTATATAVDVETGDFDRDGKPDLVVLFWMGGVRLYRNLGGGRFVDATDATGLTNTSGPSLSTVLFDYDNDGWLDLLVTAQAPAEDAIRCLLQPSFRSARNTPRLFRNKGNGTFEEVTQKVGLDRSYGTTQAVVADFDDDGWADLLLAGGSLDVQRLGPSVVLRNQKGRQFREWFHVPAQALPANTVGASVADFNHDGLPEIYLASHPVLRGRGVSGGLIVSSREHVAAAAVSQRP